MDLPFSLGTAPRPGHGIDVSVCLFVCLSVPSPPEAWTFKNILEILYL